MNKKILSCPQRTGIEETRRTVDKDPESGQAEELERKVWFYTYSRGRLNKDLASCGVEGDKGLKDES